MEHIEREELVENMEHIDHVEQQEPKASKDVFLGELEAHHC